MLADAVFVGVRILCGTSKCDFDDVLGKMSKKAVGYLQSVQYYLRLDTDSYVHCEGDKPLLFPEYLRPARPV
jgi:hypothetical protein